MLVYRFDSYWWLITVKPLSGFTVIIHAYILVFKDININIFI